MTQAGKLTTSSIQIRPRMNANLSETAIINMYQFFKKNIHHKLHFFCLHHFLQIWCNILFLLVLHVRFNVFRPYVTWQNLVWVTTEYRIKNEEKLPDACQKMLIEGCCFFLVSENVMQLQNWDPYTTGLCFKLVFLMKMCALWALIMQIAFAQCCRQVRLSGVREEHC